MNKLYTFLLSAVLLISTASAQVVFTSNFTSWNDTVPTDWFGDKTSLHWDSIIETNMGSVNGGALAQLVNTTSSHRRLTTQPITLDSNTAYLVEMWVKGQGEIRTNYYTNAYGSYNAYEQVSTSTWTKIEQTITPSQYSDTAELILSFRNTLAPDHLMIDSVALSVVTLDTFAVSIYDVQYTADPSGDSPFKDELVSISGVVTAIDSGQGYYIQDATGPWNGVLVYSNDTTPTMGNTVEITGQVTEYFGLTEITNVVSYEDLGISNLLVEPTVINSDQMDQEMFEGVLIEISGACTNPDLLAGNAQDYGDWVIDDTATVSSDLYFFEPTLGSTYTVTGVVSYDFGSFVLKPRDINDIDFTSGLMGNTKIDFKIYPNPTNGFIMVDAQALQSIKIYNAFGQVVYAENSISRTTDIDLSYLAKGIYTLELATEKGKAQSRVVIQ